MSKKKIFISVLILCFLLFFIFLFIKYKAVDKIDNKNNEIDGAYIPDLLSIEEKAQFDIPENIKVQAFRGADKEIKAYKIIKNDWDLVPGTK